jgi:hypothetical protein
MKRLAKNFADYLIEEGLVRDPYTEGDEPVIFLEINAPSPDDLTGTAETDITVTFQTSGGSGTRPYQGFLDRRGIDVTFRCKRQKEKDVVDLSNAIDYLIDDKRAWIMGDIRVEISQLARPLTFIPIELEDQGGVYQAEYRFLIRKSELQG